MYDTTEKIKAYLEEHLKVEIKTQDDTKLSVPLKDGRKIGVRLQETGTILLSEIGGDNRRWFAWSGSEKEMATVIVTILYWADNHG